MAILDPLPKSLAEALSQLPDPGNRNVWLFTIATRARHHASPQKVRRFLLQISSQWHDRNFTPEIERAVARVFESSSGNTPKTGQGTSQTWPAFNPEAWEQRKGGPTLFGSTPLPITAEEAIDRLYSPPPRSIEPSLDDSPPTTERGLSSPPPEPPAPVTQAFLPVPRTQSKIPNPKSKISQPLLCLALDTRSAQTQPREAWRGVESGMQFIVANPMTAPTGLNQDGRPSTRCHGNATQDRRFQVVEFDRGTLREQAAILTSLHSPEVPLIMVVWSGGKSLHGWFDVSGLPPYWKLRFFRHAVYLGADSSLWDPSKLVRLPGGRRDNGTPQPILHFNLTPPGAK